LRKKRYESSIQHFQSVVEGDSGTVVSACGGHSSGRNGFSEQGREEEELKKRLKRYERSSRFGF